jgi:hypothetical protein
MVRAKFICNAVEKVKKWSGSDVKNKFLYNKFFESTPSGEIKINSVGDFFEPGKEYYIDFTAAE